MLAHEIFDIVLYFQNRQRNVMTGRNLADKNFVLKRKGLLCKFTTFRLIHT